MSDMEIITELVASVVTSKTEESSVKINHLV